MKKLAFALASTAIAAAASSTFVSTAEAGGRGGHRFHFGFHRFHHFHAPPTVYRDDDDYYYRRRKPKVIVKEVVKHVPVPAKPVAVSKPKAVAAKFADGEGREFDRVSKVWFDGANQCWKGDKAFSFRDGSWFYGSARWVETSNGWGVSSGALPQQVSCAGIQAFSGKIQQAEVNQRPAPKAEPKAIAASEPTPAQVAEAPQPAPAPAPVAAPAPQAPAAPANVRECKKYFPSVGEMVSVPCSE